MKKIVYSPDAIEKIQQIERRIRAEFGSNVADKVKKTIIKKIRSLKKMEKLGISMYDMYGVTPDYRRPKQKATVTFTETRKRQSRNGRLRHKAGR